jgi:hypothetical protein
MAANTITQLSTANTFQHWLTATQLLIATANLITNGNGETFYANTRLEIGGTDATLNVTTGATINVLEANVINTSELTTANLTVTQNITAVNVTSDIFVGDDLIVYGQTTLVGDALVSGNLVVSGNLTLDSIGFDDLDVSGSGTFGNNLTVIGNTTVSQLDITGNISSLNVTSTLNVGTDAVIFGNLSVDDTNTTSLSVTGISIFTGNGTFANAEVTDTLTANVFAGNANTQIYNAIASAENNGLAFAVALG